MQKVLDIPAKTLSIVLYPLLIPTYGMGLFFAAMHVHSPEMPATLAWLSVVGTLFLTCLIPVSLIIWMWRRGQLTSLYIEDPKQRTTPYIYTTVCYAFWCYFVRATMHLPLMWLLLAIGATLALAVGAIINRRGRVQLRAVRRRGRDGGCGGGTGRVAAADVRAHLPESPHANAGGVRLPAGAGVHVCSQSDNDVCVSA